MGKFLLLVAAIAVFTATGGIDAALVFPQRSFHTDLAPVCSSLESGSIPDLFVDGQCVD